MASDRSSADYSAEIEAARAEIESAPDPDGYSALLRLARDPQVHFAVGFGGGSLHGLAGNCALAGLLEELGLRPCVREIWGTSAGALVGAAWAGGMKGTDILDGLLDAGVGTIRRPPFRDIAKSLVLWAIRREVPEGIYPCDRIRAAVDRGLPVATFEECQLPFRAIACTDDGRAVKRVFDSGPLVEAVLASMAIPGYFFPVRDWNGREHGYMDGGIVEKTPLLSVIEAHVRAGRGAKLFVLCTHFDSEARLQPPKGCVKRMLHTLERAEEKAWEYQLAQARQVPGCTFAVLNPRMEHGGMFDFEMLRPNYLWARRVFKKRMSNPEFPLLLFAR